ncbi:MAG TPA: sensor histidine kinase, partial [Anaerolineales bacterium]
WLFEQVQAGSERLQILSRRLVEVQEKERLYIARELHDQASQTLSSLILGLGILEKDTETPPSIQTRIAGLKEMTGQVLKELHRLAINLRPASLDHLGLTPALLQFINAFSQDTHLPIRFKTVGFDEDERLSQDMETTLYRIVQEALTNVIRHAKASRADVVLERRGRSMLVIVEDDGKGFDPGLDRGSGHLGLLGMQERAEMLGGVLTVESLPGKGTTLFVEVPYAHTDFARG